MSTVEDISAVNGESAAKPIKAFAKAPYVQLKPTPPQEIGDIDECKDLVSGDKYIIDSQVTNLKLGFSWTTTDTDVDASVAVFDKDLKCIDVIWWDKQRSKYCGIVHLRDDKSGVADPTTTLNETIQIDMGHLPAAVHYILPVITIYSKGKSFISVTDLAMSLIYAMPQTITGDPTTEVETSICKYKPAAQFKSSAVVLGLFTRYGPWWSYSAFEKNMNGRTVKEVVYNMNIETLVKDPSMVSQDMKVYVTVLEGHGLAASDFTLYKPKSSDCFVEVKYKEKRICSDVIEQCLDPKWSMPRMELDTANEATYDYVEISVWDHDTESPDDFLGCVNVALGGVVAKGLGTHELELALGPSPDPEVVPSEGVEIQGSILLKFEVVAVE